MLRLIRALVDGLLLRCPRCHRGRMFSSPFRMRERCPVCDLQFERATGEITGGMGINIVVVLLLVVVGSALVGFSDVPLLPTFLVGGAAIILFAICFYPFSRGIWAALLYVTGAGAERD